MSDYMKEAERLPELHRETVDDALEVVDTFGPWGMDINEDLRRQIVLADEVRQLRKLYSAAVKGRQDMRTALRVTRAALKAALTTSAGSAEAERLVDEYGDAVSDVVVFAQDPAGYSKRVEATRAALLAHIQRGAVPEDERAAFESWIENEAGAGAARRWLNTEAYENGRVQDYRTGWIACLEWLAAPAPDHFRGVTKMVAGPLWPTDGVYPDIQPPATQRDRWMFDQGRLAERRIAATPAPAGVPMPKPVAYGIGNTAITGHTNRLMMVRIDIPGGDQYAGAFWLPLVLADEAHTYGAACHAAGEAAGYARGRAEAGRDAEAFRAAVRLGLCVNCYTSADCIADGSAAVEIYASEIADSIHVKAIPDPYAAARSAVFAAANQIDALCGEAES